MPREQDDEAGDDEQFDNELPDESDQDPPGEEFASATDECPHCGDEIYWGSEWCPKCGEYLSREDAPATRKSWFIVAVIVSLAIVMLWAIL